MSSATFTTTANCDSITTLPRANDQHNGGKIWILTEREGIEVLVLPDERAQRRCEVCKTLRLYIMCHTSASLDLKELSSGKKHANGCAQGISYQELPHDEEAQPSHTHHAPGGKRHRAQGLR
jgi:hypothetical protein